MYFTLGFYIGITMWGETMSFLPFDCQRLISQQLQTCITLPLINFQNLRGNIANTSIAPIRITRKLTLDYLDYLDKNGHILPTGQWYAPSAVINNVWRCIVLHGIAWYCMVLHGIAEYCMVFHGIAWYCMVLHCIA